MRQTIRVGGALHLYSGLTLGRYELVLRVAAGGMGEVWAARLRREHGFQKLFALKVLRPELSRDPSFERMFLDEAALAARIRHPNVVTVVDLGEQDGTLFLVMEWVSGEPLSSALRSARGRPAPPLVAARIAYQICAGLEAAHELCDDDGLLLGLVHCDVSPENVLVTSEGLVRLVDFGVATYDGAPLSERGHQRGAAQDDTWAGCQRDRELRGKVPYMAPEHILGEASDRRADLFAVGILLYELLSGTHPFLAEDDRITMTRIASSSPAAPPSSRVRAKRRELAAGWGRGEARLNVSRDAAFVGPDTIPPALDRVVSEALAKLPEQRTPTAACLMRALEQAVPGASMQSSDAWVAQWLGAVLGEEREARTRKLREALEIVGRGHPDSARTPAVSPAASPPRASDGAPVSAGRRSAQSSLASSRRGARAACATALAVAGCALGGLAARGDAPPRHIDDDAPASSSRDDRRIRAAIPPSAPSLLDVCVDDASWMTAPPIAR